MEPENKKVQDKHILEPYDSLFPAHAICYLRVMDAFLITLLAYFMEFRFVALLCSEMYFCVCIDLYAKFSYKMDHLLSASFSPSICPVFNTNFFWNQDL